MEASAFEVVHNADEKRFEVRLGDDIAMIEYLLHGKNITMHHTEVPPAFEGKGVASKMAKFALDYARDHEYKVIPTCPFVNQYIERHPEYKSIVWGS